MDVTRPVPRRLVLPVVVGLLGCALSVPGAPGAPSAGAGRDAGGGPASGHPARTGDVLSRPDARNPVAAAAPTPRNITTEAAPSEGGASELPAPVARETAGPAAVSAAEGAPASTRLVVRLDEDAAPRAGTVAAARLGADPEAPIVALDAYAVEVPTDRAGTVARTLERRDDVEEVVVARRREVLGVPNDPQWRRQATAMRAVHFPEAWTVTRGSDDVTVAVVDTGVDVTHPDLAGKIAGTYNAVTGHRSDGAEGSRVRDTWGHGTAVASVAAASTGNGRGIAGAGGRARILAVKVADERGDIWSDAVAEGIAWAADHGADVVNVSLGSRRRDGLEASAVAYARRKGVVVVAAAGNDGTRDHAYPAALPGVVAVGATVPDGTRRAPFSTYGPWVDVAAPGARVRVAVPGGHYATFDGTSFSAPLVAGQLALVAAHHPTWRGRRLAASVRTTTRRRALPFAYGLVHVRASLRGPRVDDVAPRLRVARAEPHAFRPGRRGPYGRTRLVVRGSETLRSLELRIRGGGARRYTVQRRHVLAGPRVFRWDGRRAHRRVPPGRYRFRFVAVDLAGNRTLSRWRAVRVRAR